MIPLKKLVLGEKKIIFLGDMEHFFFFVESDNCVLLTLFVLAEHSVGLCPQRDTDILLSWITSYYLHLLAFILYSCFNNIYVLCHGKSLSGST